MSSTHLTLEHNEVNPFTPSYHPLALAHALNNTYDGQFVLPRMPPHIIHNDTPTPTPPPTRVDWSQHLLYRTSGSSRITPLDGQKSAMVKQHIFSDKATMHHVQYKIVVAKGAPTRYCGLRSSIGALC